MVWFSRALVVALIITGSAYLVRPLLVSRSAAPSPVAMRALPTETPGPVISAVSLPSPMRAATPKSEIAPRRNPSPVPSPLVSPRKASLLPLAPSAPPRVAAVTEVAHPLPVRAVSLPARTAPLVVAAASFQGVHTPVMASPHDPPRILDVEISKLNLRGGETVSGHVTTSSNVASVEARVEGYSANLARVGVGEFAISYTVPVIPTFLHGAYAMRIIARNVDGVQATRELPVTIH